jgi:DNA/RNA endonuclease G (NUC1)
MLAAIALTACVTARCDYIDDALPTDSARQVLRHDGFGVIYDKAAGEYGVVVYEVNKTKLTPDRNRVKASFKACPLCRSLPATKFANAKGMPKNMYLDKSHAYPSESARGDMNRMKGTFVTCNILPCPHGFNAGADLRLEEHERDLAMAGHRVVVIKAPIHKGVEERMNGDGPLVPSRIVKVMSVDGEYPVSYVFDNITDSDYKDNIVTLDSARAEIGIDVFPVVVYYHRGDALHADGIPHEHPHEVRIYKSK